MSGMLLAGCLDVSGITITMETLGEIITELPSSSLDIDVGMSELQVAQIFQGLDYSEDPMVLTTTSMESIKSDCGDGNPMISKMYKRDGEYSGNKVEYVVRSHFRDSIHDGKCAYQLKMVGPVEIREPSYMREIK